MENIEPKLNKTWAEVQKRESCNAKRKKKIKNKHKMYTRFPQSSESIILFRMDIHKHAI